jgi:hypothetical protein
MSRNESFANSFISLQALACQVKIGGASLQCLANFCSVLHSETVTRQSQNFACKIVQ